MELAGGIVRLTFSVTKFLSLAMAMLCCLAVAMAFSPSPQDNSTHDKVMHSEAKVHHVSMHIEHWVKHHASAPHRHYYKHRRYRHRTTHHTVMHAEHWLHHRLVGPSH